MNHFDFEKLDVYQASIEVVVLIDKITGSTGIAGVCAIKVRNY